MKLIFSWSHENGAITPVCNSDTLNDDNINFLCTLLTDDGGIGFLESIPWIDNCLNQIELIKQGQINTYEWGREAWGASICNSSVNIYSLYDENYSEKYELNDFELALFRWKQFLAARLYGESVEIQL